MLPEVQGGFGDQERERETVLRLASGQSVPVSISISIIRDRQGAMMGHALVVRDQREVTKLRHHIVISGRLAAAGEMAAGIAHEVNNPMAFIQANLNLLYRHLDEIDAQLAKELPEASLSPALDVGRERIEEALEDIAQVASIVREVRDFAHAGSGGGQIEDVNQLADSAVRLARLQLGERVQVRRDYGELPLIPCVGQDLKQLFLGLVLNAGRAVGESGTIRFTTELRADHIAVLVEDDGCGIAPKTLERVLDPSFESSALDEGTNLELAIANQIACRHGGSMSIESESELGSRQGTRVTICLPVASESQCTSSY
jgi:signal transduction histidine kinase